MPRKTLIADVKPEVLKWARESSGATVKEVAKRLRTSENAVAKWESGGGKPTVRALEKLAVYYRRPLAAFFLPKPPKDPALPADFRVLPAGAERGFSRPTRLAIREARRLKAGAAELMAELGNGYKPAIGKARIDQDPEELAARERERLKITFQKQSSWKNDYEAFGRWRTIVEGLNILVFQLKMPVEEARGFSLWDAHEAAPAVIVVNSSDYIRARSFTLFHEYAHLLLHKTGICLHDEGIPTESEQREEVFCNYFAGALLVPAADLKELISSLTDRPSAIEDADIRRLSNRFWVSKQVIWRRMHILGLTGTNAYSKKLEEWKRPDFRGARSGRTLPQPRRSLREKGDRYANIVFDARERKVINTSEALDYLSLKTEHLKTAESIVKGKR